MLSNRTYRGMTVHKDICYPGPHDAIIDEGLWDKAQTMLAANRAQRKNGTNCSEPSLLVGLLYDDTGERMTPAHASKNGRRYSYYISRSLVSRNKQNTLTGRRIPAGDIERLVEDRIKGLLCDEAELHAALEGHTTSNKREIFKSLISRIDITKETITVQVRPRELACQLSSDDVFPLPGEDNTADDYVFSIIVQVQLKRACVEMKLLIEGSNRSLRNPDPHLLQLITKAHELKAIFIRGGRSITEMANEAGLSPSYFTHLLRVGFLSPDITKAILKGSQPAQLTSRQLMTDTRLPIIWDDQHEHFGIL